MDDLDDLGLRELWSLFDLDESVRAIMRLAVAEDLGDAGDVTTQSIVDPSRTARGALCARGSGVAAGLVAGPLVIEAFGAALEWKPVAADGTDCEPGQVLAEIEGSLAEILAVERTLLNLVGRLSGIATLARRFVDQVVGTSAVVCDTRKTAPGWRRLEKYAVSCGGATLHRLGLFDALLYKDNHLAGIVVADLAETLRHAILAAKKLHTPRFVEVEVDTLEQLDEVLSIEPGLVDIVLLDNMTPSELRDAVARRDAAAPRVLLEASGGVDLATIRAIAESGVDRIAIGAMTHSAPALDVGLDI